MYSLDYSTKRMILNEVMRLDISSWSCEKERYPEDIYVAYTSKGAHVRLYHGNGSDPDYPGHCRSHLMLDIDGETVLNHYEDNRNYCGITEQADLARDLGQLYYRVRNAFARPVPVVSPPRESAYDKFKNKF